MESPVCEVGCTMDEATSLAGRRDRVGRSVGRMGMEERALNVLDDC